MIYANARALTGWPFATPRRVHDLGGSPSIMAAVLSENPLGVAQVAQDFFDAPLPLGVAGEGCGIGDTAEEALHLLKLIAQLLGQVLASHLGDVAVVEGCGLISLRSCDNERAHDARRGRRTSSPPQLGQTFRISAAHAGQKVHS